MNFVALSVTIPTVLRLKYKCNLKHELKLLISPQFKISKLLLKEVGLPNGLLPLKDIEECGYERDSGFVWQKQ